MGSRLPFDNRHRLSGSRLQTLGVPGEVPQPNSLICDLDRILEDVLGVFCKGESSYSLMPGSTSGTLDLQTWKLCHGVGEEQRLEAETS